MNHRVLTFLFYGMEPNLSTLDQINLLNEVMIHSLL